MRLRPQWRVKLDRRAGQLHAVVIELDGRDLPIVSATAHFHGATDSTSVCFPERCCLALRVHQSLERAEQKVRMPQTGIVRILRVVVKEWAPETGFRAQITNGTESNDSPFLQSERERPSMYGPCGRIPRMSEKTHPPIGRSPHTLL